MARTCTCIVCALALGLPACAHRTHGVKTASTVAGPDADDEFAPRNAYACASGQQLATQFDPAEQKLALSVDETLFRLDRVPSDTGTKFANTTFAKEKVVFWSQGDHATLEIAGVTTQCQRVASAP